MASAKATWIALGMAMGTVLVLAGPACLAWYALRPEPFTARTLRARFQSARFESAALVFTYQVENRTRRSAYLAPDVTRVLVRQNRTRTIVGEASVQLPLELEAHSVQTVEVRLGLPLGGGAAGRASTPEPPSLDAIVARSLDALDGFELVNERKGLRLLLPRGW